MGKNRNVTDATIAELIPDDKNFNKGTEFGAHLMEQSFRKFGAGRSILLDKNNRVIAGNKSLQTFADIGMEKVRIIETTGDELIAVKRTDVDLDSKKGREMALADNATNKVNLEWDDDLLQDTAEAYDINVEDWGVYLEADEDVMGISDNEHKDLSGTISSLFQIAIDCENETEQERIYNELKDKYKCRVLTL